MHLTAEVPNDLIVEPGEIRAHEHASRSKRIVSIPGSIQSNRQAANMMGQVLAPPGQNPCRQAPIRHERVSSPPDKAAGASFQQSEASFRKPTSLRTHPGAVQAPPQLKAGSLLLEQAYAVAPKEPYRIRVLRPNICSQRGLVINNYGIQDNQRFWGAIEDNSKQHKSQE